MLRLLITLEQISIKCRLLDHCRMQLISSRPMLGVVAVGIDHTLEGWLGAVGGWLGCSIQQPAGGDGANCEIDGWLFQELASPHIQRFRIGLNGWLESWRARKTYTESLLSSWLSMAMCSTACAGGRRESASSALCRRCGAAEGEHGVWCCLDSSISTSLSWTKDVAVLPVTGGYWPIGCMAVGG